MIKLKCLPTRNNRITSPFGPRVLNGSKDFHSGLDFGAITAGVIGDPIMAVADGTIVVSKANGGGVNKGYGYYIIIQHDGFCSLYAHLKQLGLKVGTNVKAGDIIGYMGSSGSSTAAHLHFEIRDKNYTVDFFKADSNGMQMYCVDPAPHLIIDNEPEWEKAVRATHDKAEEWIDYYQYLIDQGGLGKFIPASLMKLYKK